MKSFQSAPLAENSVKVGNFKLSSASAFKPVLPLQTLGFDLFRQIALVEEKQIFETMRRHDLLVPSSQIPSITKGIEDLKSSTMAHDMSSESDSVKRANRKVFVLPKAMIKIDSISMERDVNIRLEKEPSEEEGTKLVAVFKK